MFLIDKYPIRTIDDMLFNKDVFNELVYIASNENIPHIILSGPKGSGKQSLIRLFLEMLFDKDVNKLSEVTCGINGSSSKKEAKILQSRYHIVIKPTNTNLDKHIIQDVVKRYATYRQFDVLPTKRSFKVIVIYNIDMLAASSQAAMRRTMEQYANSCRFILSCNNPSLTWDSLRSRCTIITIKPPTISQIETVIGDLCLKEDYYLKRDDKKFIMENCHFDLRKAIWMLDCTMLGVDRLLPLDHLFEEVINDIINLKTAKKLTNLLKREIEMKVEQILINNIKKTEVIETLTMMFINRLDDDSIVENIIKCASETEYCLVKGRREIIPTSSFISGAAHFIINADNP